MRILEAGRWGRRDVSFGFERHYIRGQEKMQLRAGLALPVMLAMALGWIKTGKKRRPPLPRRPAARRLKRLHSPKHPR
jgi:hypothetical protein